MGMFRSMSAAGAILSYTMMIGPVSAAVNIDYVAVGNPGNAADPMTGFGAVPYSYRISKYEVTNSQYVEFLNAVDPGGTNERGLYHSEMSLNPNGGINFNAASPSGSKYTVKVGGADNDADGIPNAFDLSPNNPFTFESLDPTMTFSYAHKPVAFVNWFDAVRMANWLHNGQGTGSTETGAYTLTGNTSIAGGRSANATVFIPTENEWYKAAYHQPATTGGDSDDYWLYPTTTNDEPISRRPPGGTNSANFYRRDDDTTNGINNGYAVSSLAILNSLTNYLTDVGIYASPSAYNTFDQGGNVDEWTETLIFDFWRVSRGGPWKESSDRLRADFQTARHPLSESSERGFRLASIPIPFSGDADADGDVDLSDLGALATYYGQPGSHPWGHGDFDGDFDVDLADLGTLATYYGAGSAQALADFQALIAVPEPASMTTLLLASILLPMRRRTVVGQ